MDALAAQPLTQRLLPDPLVADPTAADELISPPDTLAWQYPYTYWPHNYSQHAAPWLEALLSTPQNYGKHVGTSMHVKALSEVHSELIELCHTPCKPNHA